MKKYIKEIRESEKDFESPMAIYIVKVADSVMFISEFLTILLIGGGGLTAFVLTLTEEDFLFRLFALPISALMVSLVCIPIGLVFVLPFYIVSIALRGFAQIVETQYVEKIFIEKLSKRVKLR